MNIHFRLSAVLFTSFLLVIFSKLNAQSEARVRLACIAFYNVENLYDTIDNPITNDEEFTPNGPNQWTSERYKEKIKNMSYVISKIGNSYHNIYPTILGLAEVENRGVLEDLLKTEQLAPRNYSIVHYDSPDIRGVDVALLYDSKHFKVLSSKSFTLKIPGKDDFFTRDQLLVSGLLDGDSLDIIVMHWPSRRGGQKASASLRVAAADLARSIVDSIQKVRPNANIITMGDLNDDPFDGSVKEHLRGKGNKNKLQKGDLFNPYYSILKSGVGSLAYQGKWNLFDQIIISQSFLNTETTGWGFFVARVFNENFLIQDSGKFAGNPWRTFGGGVYIGGYSDHFPTYIILSKKITN